MKKFEFRLERVRRLRERERERRRLSLAEALHYQGRVEAQIHHLESIRQDEQDNLRQVLLRRDVLINDAIQSRSYDGLLIRLEGRLEEQLKQVKVVVEQRRAELLEAEKRVRMLEKLEEKEQLRYDDHVDHLDRELMDELALVAHQRRQGVSE
ncbi:flagellar FliJ family protein [bacterium]|nr:flagellar FliJ family protein [bacterium]